MLQELTRSYGYMYTERQKKLITSIECHPLKSKASIWIIVGHRLLSPKKKVYFNHKGDKCVEIARGQFSKITETACLSGWEFEADKSRYSVYVTHHWNWMNSYWMFWIGSLLGARGEQFLRFSKNYLSWYNRVLSFLTREHLVFFRYSY